MKKIVFCIILINLFVFTGCIKKEEAGNAVFTNPAAVDYEVMEKRDLLCLMMAYPEHIIRIEQEAGGNIYAVMKSGKRILYDDKKNKTFEAKLNNPDLQDMMEQVYPLTDAKKLMEQNFDPGRFRSYSLLNEVYGRSKKEVYENLISVNAGGRSYQFNRSNNAAESLRTVMKELIPLAQGRKAIYPFVFPINGTFNYRLIAGTNRLSPHAFGTAIDLARDRRDYWKWTTRSEGEKRLASYPLEIVHIFEKNNFIWGGKWGHFDILHFEYRPELIIKSKYFSVRPDSHKSWYDGVPLKNDFIRDLVERIDRSLK